MMSLLADADPVADAARRLALLDAEHLILPVLVQLVVIIAAARLFGALARKVGQPAVVGEIVAGLVLGPSLLGWLAPDFFAAVFRPELAGVDRPVGDAMLPKVFTVIAQIGLIFLLFLVGLEFEGRHVREHGRAAVLISLTGIAVPFALDAGLAPVIHPYFRDHPVPLLSLTLFMGVPLSITAMPLMARIRMGLGMPPKRVWALRLRAAVVDEAVGCMLLARVAAAVKANFVPLESLRMAAVTVAFALFMVFAARPLLVRYFGRSLRAGRGRLG